MEAVDNCYVASAIALRTRCLRTYSLRGYPQLLSFLVLLAKFFTDFIGCFTYPLAGFSGRLIYFFTCSFCGSWLVASGKPTN